MQKTKCLTIFRGKEKTIGETRDEHLKQQVKMQMCNDPKHIAVSIPANGHLKMMVASEGHAFTQPGKSKFRFISREAKAKTIISLQPAQLIGTFGNQPVSLKSTVEKP